MRDHTAASSGFKDLFPAGRLRIQEVCKNWDPVGVWGVSAECRGLGQFLVFSNEPRTDPTVCNTLYSADNFPISQGEASHKSLLSGRESFNNLSSQAIVSPCVNKYYF